MVQDIDYDMNWKKYSLRIFNWGEIGTLGLSLIIRH